MSDKAELRPVILETCSQGRWNLELRFGSGDDARDAMRRAADFYRNSTQPRKQDHAGIDWRPIETAPKDGGTFITYAPPFRDGDDPDIDIAGYTMADGEFWKYKCGFDYVTHWTPLVRPAAEYGK